MKDPFEATASPLGSRTKVVSHGARQYRFVIVACSLVAGFAIPLFQVLRFALQGELYSYIFLVPIVSLYFVWQNRQQLKVAGPSCPAAWATLLLFTGSAALIGYAIASTGLEKAALQDQFAYAMLAFVLLLAGVCALFLPRAAFSGLLFPLGFLIFLAPLPLTLEIGLETFLQHASAVVAHGMFTVAGTPVFRDIIYFRLPGFSLEVAPECSGIHSTIALFITSVVAGRMLLRSPWKRAILTLIVLPIALLRNGLRIFIIGELCVHVGPEMIDSYIHRHGGPVFFVLSLVPFSLITYCLLRSERSRLHSPLKN